MPANASPHADDPTPQSVEPTNQDGDPTPPAPDSTARGSKSAAQAGESTARGGESTEHDGRSTLHSSADSQSPAPDSTAHDNDPTSQARHSTIAAGESTSPAHDSTPQAHDPTLPAPETTSPTRDSAIPVIDSTESTPQGGESVGHDSSPGGWAAIGAFALPNAGDDHPDRLVVRRNPVLMFCSAGPWAATAYLATYLPLGVVAFGGCLVVLIVSGLLNITWLGLPLLIGAAAVLRGCTAVERRRARLVGPVIRSAYRPVTGTGMFAHLRTRWHDPATWRDIAYVIGLFPALLLLDIAGLAIWLACLAGITLPIWYWSISNLWGTGPVGLPMALLAAVLAIGLSLLASYLVVAAAWTHRAVARAVLGPYVDPLADAKRILAGPGPLPTG